VLNSWSGGSLKYKFLLPPSMNVNRRTPSRASSTTPVSLDDLLVMIQNERKAREAALSDLGIRMRGAEFELERRLALLEDQFLPDPAQEAKQAKQQQLERQKFAEVLANKQPPPGEAKPGGSADKSPAEAEARIAILELDMMEMQRWRKLLESRHSKINMFLAGVANLNPGPQQDDQQIANGEPAQLLSSMPGQQPSPSGSGPSATSTGVPGSSAASFRDKSAAGKGLSTADTGGMRPTQVEAV